MEMAKNDRMRMTRAAPTPSTRAPRLLIALLLSAAGLSAFAQAPEAASAPAMVASPTPAASVAHMARPRPAAASATPVLSALATAPTWSALTASQRQLLTPLAEDWDGLNAQQRIKWLNATPALATLPAPELARLHERMRDWTKLTPIERRDARVSFKVAKQVDAEQRQAKWEAYQALPPEKRQELAEKAAARRKAQATAAGSSPRSLTAAPKSNLVPAVPKLMAPVPVTGGLIQAKPGASTVLISLTSRRPSYQVAGESKVVANPDLVDPHTLLPKSPKAPAASELRR
jgi:hypothetical protein